MLEPSIFAQIRKENQDFYYGYINVVPGYTFNQYNTIKRAHLYLNSRYETESQYQGIDKIFFNVVLPPCEVGMRMLNLDTKSIRLWPMNPKSQFSTYLLEKELKYWLKKSKLGKTLNQIAEEAPRYGSVVLEKTPDGAKVVDLRKLVLDSTVDSIQDSRFVTTIHYMTPTEILATGWDGAQEAVERFGNMNPMQSYEDKQGIVNRQTSTPYIKIHKRYGEVKAWWLDKNLKPGTLEGDKMVRSVFIVAGADETEKNQEGKIIGDAGIVLFKAKWSKEWPFKDFHYMKTKGRWLGIGIVEMLFDVQVRVNELRNQVRVGMNLSNLHLFQTKDKSIIRNVLSDLENGDVITTQNGIEPVNNSESRFHISAVTGEEQIYSGQVDKLSFAYEALRGDSGDASTPLGTTEIAVSQGTSVFAFKKENLAIFLQEFFNDLVMPQLMKDLTPEHIMRFTGDLHELQMLDDAAAELHANDYVKKEILDGKLVLQADLDAAKQKALDTYRKLGESRYIKIKKAFYADAEFEFDFLITDEQADPSKMATNLQSLISELLPQLGINDPRVQLLVNKFAEQLGISPSEMAIANQDAAKQQSQMQVPPDGGAGAGAEGGSPVNPVSISMLQRMGNTQNKIPSIPHI